MSGSQLREDVLGFMKANPSQPVTKSLLARRLQIPVERRSELRRVIESLIAEGIVEERKKACFALRQGSANRLVGTLKFHPKGHAIFFADPGDTANLATGLPLSNFARLQISRRDAGLALDGDRVLISIQLPKPHQRSHARGGLMPSAAAEPRGRVEKVLARRSGRLVGIYRQNKGFGWIECADKAVDGHIDLIGDTTAQAGQLVVVDMTDWQDPAMAPRGRVIEVLGWPGGPGVDIISVIHRYGLRTSFPDEVLAAARAVPEEVDPDEMSRREDWRKHLVITIDPADAKDHDDAIWLQKTRKGWRLAVHIADVSHYIKPDSVMDKEAVERGNSTYLVDRVLPMLPVELSNGICSLKPNVDRLTKCALMEVLHDGQVTRADFVDAVIHSRAKLSYEQAQQILDGGEAPAGSDPDLASMVREAWKMAAALRRRRFEAGALDLEMPEIKVRLDADGRAVGADPVIHAESHQLIEECMLAANDAVAKVLRERMKPAVYRIHEDPDPSRLMDYTETAMLHGYRPGDLTNRNHIQKLLDQSKGSPEEHIIKLGLLKSLKRAAYAAEPIGHYGLAKTDYCHFTSPIRRYADLIVHRALQPLLRNPPKNPDRTPSQADLREISRHISDTERNSAEAENETKQIKLFEYLQRIAEMHDPHVFDGLVTDVRPMGLMIEIPDMAIRGVVKREDLPPGRWRLEGHRGAWVSADGMVIAMGMRVPLHVTGLDLEKRFVDFSVAGAPTSAGTQSIHPRQSMPARRREKPTPKPAAKAGPPRGAKKQAKRKSKRRR